MVGMRLGKCAYSHVRMREAVCASVVLKLNALIANRLQMLLSDKVQFNDHTKPDFSCEGSS